jgi:hypothetical protein
MQVMEKAWPALQQRDVLELLCIDAQPPEL